MPPVRGPLSCRLAEFFALALTLFAVMSGVAWAPSAVAGTAIKGLDGTDEVGTSISIEPDAVSAAHPRTADVSETAPILFIGRQPVDRSINFVSLGPIATAPGCNYPVYVTLRVFQYPKGTVVPEVTPESARTALAGSLFPILTRKIEANKRWLLDEPVELKKGDSYGFFVKVEGIAQIVDEEDEDQVAMRDLCLREPLRVTTYPALDPPKSTDKACVRMPHTWTGYTGTEFSMYRVWMNLENTPEYELRNLAPSTRDLEVVEDLCNNNRTIANNPTGNEWGVAYRQGNGWAPMHFLNYEHQRDGESANDVRERARKPSCLSHFREQRPEWGIVDNIRGELEDHDPDFGYFQAWTMHKCTWASWSPDPDDPDSMGWYWAYPNGPGLPGLGDVRQQNARQIVSAKLARVASAPGLTDYRQELGGVNPAAPEAPRCDEADPVNCASGNFYEDFTELVRPGRGTSVAIARTYNAQAAVPSAAPATGMFGKGWSTPLESKIVPVGTAGDIEVHHGNGSTVTFAKDGSSYKSEEWVRSTLTRDESTGKWTYRLADQSSYVYDAVGKLVSAVDEIGQVTSFNYVSGRLKTIVGGGRGLNLDYNTNGTVSAATEIGGRKVMYGYDASGTQLVRVTDPAGGVSTFSYDSRGRMVTKTDPRGATTTNEYDAKDRVVKQTDPLGKATNFEYTGGPEAGTTKVIDREGVVTLKTFSAMLPISEVRGYGTSKSQRVRMWHNERAQLRRLETPSGVTKYEYDRYGNQSSVTDANRKRATSSYNSKNQLLNTVSPEGRMTIYLYDAVGNLTRVRKSKAGASGTAQKTFTYDAFGQPLTVTDELGRVTTNEYDSLGNLTKTTSPGGRVSTFTYDVRGNVLTQTLPAGNKPGAVPSAHRITYTRDVMGAPLTVTDAAGGVTTNTYDIAGNLVSTKDGDGRLTTFVLDALGRTTQQTRGDGGVDKWAYTPEGRLLTRTDGLGRVTRYAYDEIGRQASVTDQGGRVTSTTYNGTMRMDRRSDGTQIWIMLDQVGRVLSIEPRNPEGGTSSVTGRTTYSYDGDGNPTFLRSAGSSTSLRYDGLGRVIERTTRPDDARGKSVTSTFAYDAVGNLSRLGYPTAYEYTNASPSVLTQRGIGSVYYDYDEDGLMTRVTDPVNRIFTFEYDANGALSKANYPGRAASYTRDVMGRPITIGTPAGSRNYTYSPAGVPKSATFDPSTVTNFDVDGALHLTGMGTQTSAFDAAENPIEIREPDGRKVTQFFNADGRMSSRETSGTPYAYSSYLFDSLGRRTEEHSGANGLFTRFQYDSFDQLKYAFDISDAAGMANDLAMHYGPTGLRTAVSRAGVVRAEVWEESLAGAPLLVQGLDSYVYGPGGMVLERISASGAAVFHWQDAIGTVIGGTTEAGVTTKLKYDTWGRRMDPSPSTSGAVGSLGFAGQAMEPGLDLTYMRARYYDPKSAQFITVDPKLASTGQPYLYANGNPTMFTDPTGESFAENFTNGMIHGASGGILKPGSAEGSCSRAYFLGAQAGGALSPGARLKKLDELLGAAGSKIDDVVGGAATKLLPAFTKSTIDGVMASATSLGRGGQVSRGAQAIDKKLGHARSGGYESAFAGLSADDATAQSVILQILENPTLVERMDRVVDVYDASGRGLRYRRDTGEFQGFLEFGRRKP